MACKKFLHLKRTGSDDVTQEKATITKTDVTTSGKSFKEKLGEKLALGDKLVLHSNSVITSGISNFGIIAAEEKEIDTSLKTLGLTESDWHLILVCSYSLAEKSESESESESLGGKKKEPKNILDKIGKEIKGYSDRAIRLTLLQKELKSVRKQYDIDGVRNIWIVKAPDTSRGVGLQLLYKLEDVLECQKGMGCRTVQKYIEIPLLATKIPNTVEYLPNDILNDRLNNVPNSIKNNSRKNNNHEKTTSDENLGPLDSRLDDRNVEVKFDIRVWVLVTSYELSNLSAYVYTTVYGRRCGVPYNLNIKMLGDNFIHLTNYSVQKKGVVLEMGSGSGISSGSVPGTGSGIEKVSGTGSGISSGSGTNMGSGIGSGSGSGMGMGWGTEEKVSSCSQDNLEEESGQRCTSFGSHSSRRRCESEDAGEGSLTVRSCSYSNPLQAVRSLRLRSNSARGEIDENEKDVSVEKEDRNDEENNLIERDRTENQRSKMNKTHSQRSSREKEKVNGSKKVSHPTLLRSRSSVGVGSGKGVGRGGTGRAGHPLPLHIHAHAHLHNRHRSYPGKSSDKTPAVSMMPMGGAELLIGTYSVYVIIVRTNSPYNFCDDV